jgi:hypothetical protein
MRELHYRMDGWNCLNWWPTWHPGGGNRGQEGVLLTFWEFRSLGQSQMHN